MVMQIVNIVDQILDHLVQKLIEEPDIEFTTSEYLRNLSYVEFEGLNELLSQSLITKEEKYTNRLKQVALMIYNAQTQQAIDEDEVNVQFLNQFAENLSIEIVQELSNRIN